MKAKKVLHICIEHREGCKDRWYQDSVEDGTVYTVCSHCYELDCKDERELTKGVEL